MKKDKISAIYLLKYRGGVYIGASNNVWHRFNCHRNLLSKGTHHSKKFQKEYSKYGGELEFKISILLPEYALSYYEYRMIKKCRYFGIKLWNGDNY